LKHQRKILIKYLCLLILIITFQSGCRKIPDKSVLFCYKQVFLVDPTDIPDSLLPMNAHTDSLKKIMQSFEHELKQLRPEKVEYKHYLRIIFRYRDPLLIPVFKKILLDSSNHNYFRLLAVYAVPGNL